MEVLEHDRDDEGALWRITANLRHRYNPQVNTLSSKRPLSFVTESSCLGQCQGEGHGQC